MNYPHEPPKVKCETPVYHPNIDLEGNVCLNILREDWKPVLTINSIVYGLQYLFLVCIIYFSSKTGYFYKFAVKIKTKYGTLLLFVLIKVWVEDY